MGVYDKSLGALLIGTWANSMLLMLEVVQVIRYLNAHWRTDNKVTRYAVLLAFLSDIVCTSASYACVYLYTVTHWGDLPYLANQYWPIPLYIGSTGCTAAIVQAYLILRYWSLTGNRIVFGILIVLLLCASGGSLAVVVSLIVFPTYEERAHILYSANAWLITSAVTDISIAFFLIYHLAKKEVIFKSTRRLVRKLTSMTIRTGTLTSIFALLVLFNYVFDLTSNVTVGFGFCLGRIYSITMLYNLNNRARLRGPTDPMIDLESINLSKMPSRAPGSTGFSGTTTGSSGLEAAVETTKMIKTHSVVLPETKEDTSEVSGKAMESRSTMDLVSEKQEKSVRSKI